MRHAQWLPLPIFALVCIAVLTAQAPKTFKGRIAPVPIDLSMQAAIAGTGSVTAVLTGAKLSVTGAFDGLKSPPTIGQVPKSPGRGGARPGGFHLGVATTGPGSRT